MANIIQIKRGAGAPGSGVLAEGELGFDKTNEAIYIGKDGTSNIKVGAANFETRITNLENRTYNYAGSSSDGGAATSANKLNTDAGSTTNPVYFVNGIPTKTTYTLGASVPSGAKFTDTTYSAGTGISLSGTTFSNSGVRSITTGTTNGTISVNTNGTSTNVAVKGLGTAAYAATGDFRASSWTPTTREIGTSVTKPLTAQGWYKVGTITGTAETYATACNITLTITGSWNYARDTSAVVDILSGYNYARAWVRIPNELGVQITRVGLVKVGNKEFDVLVYYNAATSNSVHIKVHNFQGNFTAASLESYTVADESAMEHKVNLAIPYPYLLSAEEYGTTLPTAGTAGRIFFKKVSS